MTYPAISIRQPWAWAILHADKDVENRTWRIPQKYLHKPVLMHAGVKVDTNAFDLIASLWGEAVPTEALEKGGIVGALVFAGQNTSFSPWRAKGQNQWAIERAWPLPFHPCKGQLGFFQVGYPHNIEACTKGVQ